ncbi:MAG: PBP1A family penicillin-binding protein [Patescibacteria group bacterium]|nr:PBP1A family penicillin-binding protein [Patescibacteria group bacterium]MDD5554273.1 PBP1A family penicillin-binding protein [Patescibacteria group bacterium]
MPIPQLSYSNKNRPSWRGQKKKYYLSKKKGSFRIGSSSQKPKSNFKNKNFGGLVWAVLSNRKVLKFLTLFILAAIIFGMIFVAWVSRGLPDPNKLMERQVAQSTKIYDRTGETILYEIHGEEKRTLVNLNEIPDYVKWATIAVEDKNFYKHGGISLWSIFRGVVWQTLQGKRAQGGSTLTQQFVKNAILTPERTITRKIREWILSYQIEKKFRKDEILQMYFNEIPYGSTAYGVEAASQKYFGKSVKDINLAEAAILAALPQAPSRYSPYGSNLDILIQRQHYILDLMKEQGYVPEAKAEAAKQFKLEFKKQTENITAPHFVMYIKEMLSEKYGEKMIEQEGLKIYTTLDLYKQKIAEEVITAQAEKNEKNYNASNAALVSIDPKTGQILAMVGSRDYFNDEIDGQVNVTTSLRQPGSSLKPLVYSAAFIKGYTPDTVLYDVVTNFSSDPDNPYEPHNYDSREHGPVTMKKALAGSLNIPAVKTIYLAGIDNVLNLASDFGYTSLSDRDRFGLSLVLGGGEVKLLEHTNAYGVFAREGLINPVAAILKIEDKNGKVIEEFKQPEEKRVLDPKIARMINGVLSDNSARAYIFGESNWLTLGSRPVGAKTGTTNDYHDAWTIGYTPSIVTGVWVGNSDNTAMKRGADGSVVAAPIWHDFMQKVLGDTPVEEFKPAEIEKTGKPVLDGEIGDGEKVKIDLASGLLATPYTPESFIKEITYRQDHCLLYYVNKDDPRGPAPKNPGSDPQFELWESQVLAWAKASSTVAAAPPTEYDSLHKPENRPEFQILSPGNNETIMDPLLTARIKASAPRGVNRAEYYIDNNLIINNNIFPFSLEKNISFLNNGFHNLKVRICDDIDNCSEQSLEFNLILDEKTGAKGDITISWLEPADNSALTNAGFPVNLKMHTSNPDQTARIDIFLVGEDGSPALITSLQPIVGETASGSWKNLPVSGTYKLYGQARSWSGQTKKSGEITVTVSN